MVTATRNAFIHSRHVVGHGRLIWSGSASRATAIRALPQSTLTSTTTISPRETLQQVLWPEVCAWLCLLQQRSYDATDQSISSCSRRPLRQIWSTSTPMKSTRTVSFPLPNRVQRLSLSRVGGLVKDRWASSAMKVIAHRATLICVSSDSAIVYYRASPPRFQTASSLSFSRCRAMSLITLVR